MVVQNRVGPPDDGRRVDIWFEDEHGVNSLFSLDREADHADITGAGL